MYTCIFVVNGYDLYLFEKYFSEKPHGGQLVELKAFELIAEDQHTKQYGDVFLHGLFVVTAMEMGTIEELFPTLNTATREKFRDCDQYVKVYVTELVQTCKEVKPHILEPHLVAFTK